MYRTFLFFTLMLLGMGVQGAEDFAQNRLLPWYFDTPAEATSEHQWQLDVGVELGWEPDYVGSDDNEVEAFPGLAAHYRWNDDLRFRLTPETLVGVWDLNERTLVQLVIEYEEGREAAETKDLKTLEDGKNTVEAELSLVRRVGPASFFYATYQPEIQNRDKGVVWFVGAGHQWRVADRWLITPTVDVSWGDKEHMQTEFGLNATDAATLGLAPYAAGGGIKSSTASVNLQWDLTPKLTLLGTIGIEYYFSEAANSPLVKDLGDRIGKEIEVSLLYSF